MKSFCGGVQGGQFFQKAPPLAAGGKSDLAAEFNYCGCLFFNGAGTD